jgi:hypothetical protein
MLISSHLDKINRLNDVRRRLDPLADFELWFWSTMVAGTNAVNAALHQAGLTPEESAFPSQPGVYYVLKDAGYQPVLKAKGDVLHVGRPPIEGPVPEDVHLMMEAMEQIEKYRDPCTRGDTNPSAEIVERCETAYRQCLQLLKNRLPEFTDGIA